jgi:hypothetical protein
MYEEKSNMSFNSRFVVILLYIYIYIYMCVCVCVCVCVFLALVFSLIDVTLRIKLSDRK